MVAGAIDGKLTQLGYIHEIPNGARKKLTKVLPATQRNTPFMGAGSYSPNSKGRGANKEVAKTSDEATASGDGATNEGEDGKASVGSSLKWVNPRWLCRISYIETDEGIPIDIQFHWIIRKLRGKQ